MFSNFSGKVGTIVGYTNKQSNNKQTQVVRSYQPVVRNPMTLAQATQRVKFAPVFWTYRKLKAIIDRGQEGVDYGNRSRFAWLKQALGDYSGPWYEKDEMITLPLKTYITRGSLQSIGIGDINDNIVISNLVYNPSDDVPIIGQYSETLLAQNSFLKEGDQLTFVMFSNAGVYVKSFILSTTDQTQIEGFSKVSGHFAFDFLPDAGATLIASCVVLSREGKNGQHLRSTTALTLTTAAAADTHYTSTAKDAAIASYMSAATNTDWPEEQL